MDEAVDNSEMVLFVGLVFEAKEQAQYRTAAIDFLDEEQSETVHRRQRTM